MVTSSQIQALRKKVLSYYRNNPRSFPWRKTNNPYHILVSECMLQQTQANRVIPYYYRWIKKWPTVQSLSSASRIALLTEWSGLGYNSRPLRLQNAVKIITKKYDGNVLLALQKEKLPGIGPYTASAVRIFSSNENIVAVDANIRRVLLHHFKLKALSDKEIWALAEQCLPRGKSRAWHNALMDYGALVFTSQTTKIKSRTKQSVFAGSDRQIRGKLLRLLLRSSGLTAVECCQQLHIVDKKRVSKVLSGMVADGFFVKKKTKYSLLP